jgi:hypothetical protein
VIVCGREIDEPVLEWIRTAAADLSPKKLAAQLCERLDWKGPGGQFQVSVAVGVLRRLQKLKEITLSKVQAPLPLTGRVRTPISLPAADSTPSQAQSLEEVGPLELVRVGSRYSSDYRVWRQMLDQHHYLGSGPLAGHQLRYVIKGPRGYLGALAFSAAALQLKDRDQWIGWSWEARRENLPFVINNSRFLILPGLEVPGLASAALTLATKHVAGDWLEQFGYRPVLAETFVDLERYGGACYMAANWKPIGLTQGRGRQDASRQKALSKKLVLVYPLAEDFGQKLRTLPEHRRLAAKPVAPAPPVIPPADWAEEEFGGCDLGDRRLGQRLLTLGRDLGARPTMSLPQACGDPKKLKAAYRFFDHPQVHMNNVLQGHYGATARRAQKEKLILAVQDTTELSYSAHPKIELMGPIGDREAIIGMLVHDTMAYNGQGTPLGLIDVQCWTRDPDIKRGEKARYELPIEQKESYKWLASWKAAVRLQEQCPESTVISMGDREADVYEFLVEAKKHPKARLLIRADQQRRVQGQEEEEEEERFTNLWRWMAGRAVEGVIPVELPRTAKRSRARTGRIEVRYAEVELQPPKRKPKLGPVKVWVVTATEVGAPPGEEPVDWKLITTVEVKTLGQALEVIEWYTQRFQIEVYHRTLKSGCKIEERQLGNAERIEGCLAIDMVVAWRIVHLTKLGREVPDVPCTIFFEEAQWKALVAFVTRDVRMPDKPPTLREAILMLAKSLGGFLGRKCDGEPGTEIIWKALQRLDDITQMWLVMMEGRSWSSPTEQELDSS